MAALAVVLVMLCACAAAPSPSSSAGSAAHPVAAKTPPPAQNQLGATHQHQLVAEHALELAKKYGGERVLVALDIDNTLLAMEQDLGSDQWYYWQKQLEEQDPCSPQLVNGRLEVQGALYYASAMRPTQPNAAQQVRRMQDAGLKVIALTARAPEYRLATFRELRRNGFSLWRNAWPPQVGYADPFTPAGAERPVRYEDGVLFAAGQDKGLVLQDLLTRAGVAQPVLVLMVDDKQANLQQVMKTFSFSGTKVHAWHYTREHRWWTPSTRMRRAAVGRLAAGPGAGRANTRPTISTCRRTRAQAAVQACGSGFSRDWVPRLKPVTFGKFGPTRVAVRDLRGDGNSMGTK
jgi:hypothetical protein